MSVFDAYNAKDLRPFEVARTFVPSEKFDELVGRSNAILIGPRGSGKTTLLKMLSINALRSWDHPKADEYRNSINFTGVFVPADVTWGEMVGSLGGANLPAESKSILGETAFCINVQMALIETMICRYSSDASQEAAPSYRRVDAKVDVEDLVMSIAENWMLVPRSLSFRGLYAALQQRLGVLYADAKEFSFQSDTSPASLLLKCPYAKLDVVQSVAFAITQFDALFEETAMPWAILLDEFEVAPEHIQQKIFAALRASTPKIRYKVALAPCGVQTLFELSSVQQPTQQDDFSRVELWYVEKNKVIQFCRGLIQQRLIALNDAAIKHPYDLLGKSRFLELDDVNNTEELSGVEAKTAQLFADEKSDWSLVWEDRFQSLSKKDSSFQKYLKDKEINPKMLNPNDPKMGSRLRKIAPVVLFRDAYRTQAGGIKGGNPFFKPYLGWESIATLTEGNPRWFIGLITPLINYQKQGFSLPIEDSLQTKEIKSAATTFCEKLKTAPIESSVGIRSSQSAYTLIKKIAERFRDILVKDDFAEDPCMSFVVDDAISDDDENCLRLAMNAGGIVCYDRPDHEGGFKSLRKKRFRIAFTLYPLFNLPVRSGKSILLSNLLEVTAASPPPPKPTPQIRLFDE